MGKVTAIKWNAINTLGNATEDLELLIHDPKTGEDTKIGWDGFFQKASDLGLISSTSVWAENGNDIYNSNSANVGVGTDTPLEKLHVEGTFFQKGTIGDWTSEISMGTNGTFTIQGTYLYNTNTLEAIGVFLDTNSKVAILAAQDVSGSPFPEFSAHAGLDFVSLGRNINNSTFEKGIYITDDNGILACGSGTSSNTVISFADGYGGTDLGDLDKNGNLTLEIGDLTFTTIGKGPVIKSPNGTSWRISVNDAGTLSATSI